MCEYYHREFGVQITILRPFNIYGPGQPDRFLVPNIFRQLLDPLKDSVEVATLEPKRDFLFVDDIIKAIIKTIEPLKKFAVYNVGSGSSHSVKEVIELAMKVTGIKKNIITTGVLRPNEVMDTVADISAIKNDLRWAPDTSLENGFKLLAQINL